MDFQVLKILGIVFFLRSAYINIVSVGKVFALIIIRPILTHTRFFRLIEISQCRIFLTYHIKHFIAGRPRCFCIECKHLSVEFKVIPRSTAIYLLPTFSEGFYKTP